MQLDSVSSEMDLSDRFRLDPRLFERIILRYPVCSASDPGEPLPSVRSIDDARSEGSLWQSTGVSMYYAPVTLLTRYEEEPGVLYVHLVDAENAHVAATYRGPDNVDYVGMVYQLAAADMALQSQVAQWYGQKWPSHIGELNLTRSTGNPEDESAWLIRHARDVVFFGGDDCADNPDNCGLEDGESYDMPAARELTSFLYDANPWPKVHERQSAITMVASSEDDPENVHVFLVDPEAGRVEAWYTGTKERYSAVTARAIQVQGAGLAGLEHDPRRKAGWGIVAVFVPRIPPPPEPGPVPIGTERFAKHLVRSAAATLELPTCRM
jgi:hypothetical protein